MFIYKLGLDMIQLGMQFFGFIIYGLYYYGKFYIKLRIDVE